MKKEIKLGDIVRCKITGFKGTTVEKTEYINGCIQFGVLPKCGKDGKMLEAVEIDIQSLELIRKPKKKPKKKPTGGSMKPIRRMRGY